MKAKPLRILGLFALGVSCLSRAGDALPPAKLTPAAKIQIAAVIESSGLVASRRYPGVFWTHNDSGDSAILFSIRRDGSAVSPKWMKDYQGLSVLGAFNQDWEDITTDDAGNLYIGDIGNNGNARRDLAVYLVPEPNPEATFNTVFLKRIPFAYPDQTAFPPAKDNLSFDAEALFWADGKLWLLTKHRSDTHTKLYRFDALRTDEVNVLTKAADFATDYPVSAADCSRDGKRLAILTDNSIWVCERSAPGVSWFSGKKWRRLYDAGNAEAIAWDGDDLVLTNEPGEIFVVPSNTLNPVP